MPDHDLVVMGASAGGVEALRAVVAHLPPDFPAALCVVLHIPPGVPSELPGILRRAGPLPAFHPSNGEALQPGRIYVAPPDHHLLVAPGRVRVVRGPHENRTRPAVDPLFRTAAVAYGPRAVGVVLSGALDDGTSGLKAIKARGGLAVVQDPADALYASMPRNALANVAVDHCLPVAGIGGLLNDLAHQPAALDGHFPVPRALAVEAGIAQQETGTMEENEIIGAVSPFTCPQCNGTLWEIQDGELIRYRCRVGHAFSQESMLAEQAELIDDVLWSALRSLEESASLNRRLEAHAHARTQERAAQRFAARATEREGHAAALRQLLSSHSAPETEPADQAS